MNSITTRRTQDDYETYYEFYDWTDEEWEEFWNVLEADMSPEELEYIANMEWEEFFAMMEEAYS